MPDLTAIGSPSRASASPLTCKSRSTTSPDHRDSSKFSGSRPSTSQPRALRRKYVAIAASMLDEVVEKANKNTKAGSARAPSQERERGERDRERERERERERRRHDDGL